VGSAVKRKMTEILSDPNTHVRLADSFRAELIRPEVGYRVWVYTGDDVLEVKNRVEYKKAAEMKGIGKCHDVRLNENSLSLRVTSEAPIFRVIRITDERQERVEDGEEHGEVVTEEVVTGEAVTEEVVTWEAVTESNDEDEERGEIEEHNNINYDNAMDTFPIGAFGVFRFIPQGRKKATDVHYVGKDLTRRVLLVNCLKKKLFGREIRFVWPEQIPVDPFPINDLAMGLMPPKEVTCSSARGLKVLMFCEDLHNVSNLR
jgi:hypothetical protein